MERVKILYIQRILSSMVLTIGICGLLYTLPSIHHPMYKMIFGVSMISIICIAIFLVGLISKIVFAVRKDNDDRKRLRISIPTNSAWQKSMRLAMISMTLFSTLFIFPNPTPGYAPHTFAHNVGYLFPVFITYIGFSIAGLISYIRIDNKRQLGLIYNLLPFVSILPLILMILAIIIYRLVI